MELGQVLCMKHMVFCLDGEVEYWTDEIEDIVTKEQFESVKYNFEEE